MRAFINKGDSRRGGSASARRSPQHGAAAGAFASTCCRANDVVWCGAGGAWAGLWGGEPARAERGRRAWRGTCPRCRWCHLGAVGGGGRRIHDTRTEGGLQAAARHRSQLKNKWYSFTLSRCHDIVLPFYCEPSFRFQKFTAAGAVSTCTAQPIGGRATEGKDRGRRADREPRARDCWRSP